jgi:hypothetical protein
MNLNQYIVMINFTNDKKYNYEFTDIPKDINKYFKNLVEEKILQMGKLNFFDCIIRHLREKLIL